MLGRSVAAEHQPRWERHGRTSRNSVRFALTGSQIFKMLKTAHLRTISEDDSKLGMLLLFQLELRMTVTRYNQGVLDVLVMCSLFVYNKRSVSPGFQS